LLRSGHNYTVLVHGECGTLWRDSTTDLLVYI